MKVVLSFSEFLIVSESSKSEAQMQFDNFASESFSYGQAVSRSET